MPASSPSLLAPKGPPGDMGSQVREPALSVALWLSWGAALGAVACAMALLTQQTELQTLRREVTRLQKTGGPSEKGEGYPLLNFWEQVSEGRRVSGRGWVAGSSLGLVVQASLSAKFQVDVREGPGFGGQGSSHSRKGNC